MVLNLDGTYTGYIYKIENLVNGKCYIGQTITTIEHRWTQHKSDHKSQNPMYKAFKKYGIDNFKIIEISHYTRDSKDKLLSVLNKKEIYYIKKYKSLVFENGYNLSIGGNNTGIYNSFPVDVYNREGKLLYQCDSATDVSRILNGYDVNSILDCCKGITIPIIDFIFRFRNEPYDKYETKRRNTGVTVYQFSLDGRLLGTYESAADAARVLGVNTSSITSVIYGQNKTCAGFYWNNKNEFNFLPVKDVRKQIDQYDINGNFINTYESAADAMRKMKFSNSTGITSCCKGKLKTSGSFVWRYHGDSFFAHPVQQKEKRVHHPPKQPFYDVSKKVDMYDQNKTLVKTFKSMKEAGEFLSVSKSNISACCLGKAKSVFGYIFRYHGEPIDKYTCFGVTSKQSIAVYDLDTKLTTIYPSKNKAYKETGVGYHTIEPLCNGKENHIKNNKIFLYEKDQALLPQLICSVTSK